MSRGTQSYANDECILNSFIPMTMARRKALVLLLNFTSLFVVHGFRVSIIRHCRDRAVPCPLPLSRQIATTPTAASRQEGSATPNDVAVLPTAVRPEPELDGTKWHELPLPPPPNPSSDSANDVWRAVRRKLPRWFQQRVLRDGGWLRWLIDTSSVLLAAPSIARQYPNAWRQFVQLSLGTRASRILRLVDAISQREDGRNDDDDDVEMSNVSLQVISYGSDHRQVIHLLQQQGRYDKGNPQSVTSTTHTFEPSQPPPRRLVVFVHGGAWGSGFPALYRLAAVPFLGVHCTTAVAMVGYRTYPTVASVDDQVDDVARALDLIVSSQEQPQSVVLVGHSSGAHLIALGLEQGKLTSALESEKSAFVGMAGVYDIPAHYRHEAARGVERLSPMAPICGGSVAAWRRNSPTHLAKTMAIAQTNTVPNKNDQSLLPNWPATLLLHGVCDSTVPYTSSVQFFDRIASTTHPRNRLHLLPDTEHAETVLQLMFGGPTRDVIMDWIASLPDSPCYQQK
jgi:acetyl esterase/lipase